MLFHQILQQELTIFNQIAYFLFYQVNQFLHQSLNLSLKVLLYVFMVFILNHLLFVLKLCYVWQVMDLHFSLLILRFQNIYKQIVIQRNRNKLQQNLKQYKKITANMSDQQSMNFSMDESHRIQPITISDLSHLHTKIFQTSNPHPSAIVNTCINVVATSKLQSKLILNTKFQQYLLEDPANVDTVTIAIMGSKKIGKSFLLDCLLSLQTSTVCRIMSRSNQTIINSPIVQNITKTMGNKLVYFDCAGGINNQIFLWNYVVASAIVYNIGQNDIEAQKTLINGLRYIHDKIEMQKDNIFLPELILVYRDSNNNITKSQLIKQISTYNLFQPRIKTINLPYPGYSNIQAKQLLDIPVIQIRNQFLAQTKQLLNHFISNVKPKIFKSISLSRKILSLILQPLTTQISYCQIQQQDLSINKIWNQMIQNLSIGYYNFYLKCYEKELSQQFGNQEPKSKYDVFKKLREVKYKVDKKIQAFRNLDEQPVFNKYKDRLNHVIKSKQQLIRQVNREKSGLKNQEYCKKLLSKLDGKNAQKLVQQYLKTELDQQKSDVLLQTFQNTLQERSKYLPKSQQKQNLNQKIKQGEFQINDLRKRLQDEQQKTQNLKNIYNLQKKQASIQQKKQKIHELKDHLKSSRKMSNDKLNKQYFQLTQQSDRLKQRIEINGAQINKLRVKREEDLRSITKQLADKQKKLDQNIRIAQQKLRIAKSKKPTKPQTKSKDCCCKVM